MERSVRAAIDGRRKLSIIESPRDPSVERFLNSLSVVMREHMICTCGLLAPVVGRSLDSQNLRTFESQRFAGDC